MTQRLCVTACAIIALAGVAFGQPGVLRVGGAVPHPRWLSREEIASLPHESVTVSAHEQSGRYEGMPVSVLLQRAGVLTGESIRSPQLAKYVVVTGADGYRVVFALAEFDATFADRTGLLADKRSGSSRPDNALPYQLTVPGESVRRDGYGR